MKTIEEESKKYSGRSEDKFSNVAKVYDKYDIEQAFESGVEWMKKQYDEMIRWIPVSEFDFDKYGSEYVLLKNSEKSIPVIKQVLCNNDLTDYILYRTIELK